MNRNTALAVVLFVAGGVVGWLLKPDASPALVMGPKTTIYDTTRIILERQPIYVTGTARVIRDTTRDTIVTHPFVATLDTIIGRDTVASRFSFPEMSMSVALRQGADSIRVINSTSLVPVEVQRPTPWYEYALSMAAGVAIGYIARGN